MPPLLNGLNAFCACATPTSAEALRSDHKCLPNPFSLISENETKPDSQ